jgi:hypothetical protein
MKREIPIKRPKRKKNYLHMNTWNGTSYEVINMPNYLADDFIREFVVTVVPGTDELKTWLNKKIIK